MPLPIPEPGLIINYEFLWREEKERGLDHGLAPSWSLQNPRATEFQFWSRRSR
jgi:hypothetical protein